MERHEADELWCTIANARFFANWQTPRLKELTKPFIGSLGAPAQIATWGRDQGPLISSRTTNTNFFSATREIVKAAAEFSPLSLQL